jgi:hypothetical protein
MALVTTFMTGPILNLINIGKKKTALDVGQLATKYKVLLSFATPEKGKHLLRTANSFIRKMNNNATVTAMHLVPNNELSHVNIDDYENDSFTPIIHESKVLNQKITTLFKVSNDIPFDISEMANKGEYDLLLVGFGQSIFEGTFLGRILGFTTRIINPDRLLNTVTGREKFFEKSAFEENTRLILERSKIPVGILLDKDLTKIDQVFLPIFDMKDTFLLKYALKLIVNSGTQITIWRQKGSIKKAEIIEAIKLLDPNAENHIHFLGDKEIEKDFFIDQSLMLISISSWKKTVDSKKLWLSDIPSTLIISENNINNTTIK